MSMETEEPAASENHGAGMRRGVPEWHNLLPAALVCVFFILLLRRAWLSDDAFITFRTVDNLIHGYRLTWNVTERVQAYTHPLWMLLLSLLYFFTREIYFTSLALSIGVSVIALVLLARWFALPAAAPFAIFVLILSKAYMDFSTSGLENPLSHLLIVVFFILFFHPHPGRRRLLWLSFTASLGLLTRMDLALVFLPALAAAFWAARSRKAVLWLALGQVPFVLWEIFSILYYGFPFPNTAYAKLNTGIAAAEYIRQGLFYLLNSVQFDALTPLVILLGITTTFLNRDRRVLTLAAGCLLYLAYVVQVGGDFMSGRFLTIPLLCATLALARVDFSRLTAAASLVLYGTMLVIGLNTVNPTVRINDLAPIDSGPIHLWDHGILDERLLYYGGTGLLNAPRDEPMPTFYWAIEGEKMRVAQRKVADNYGVGMFGFRAGAQVYVLDKLALADPLLARLPAFQKMDWRIGHFERVMPEGYLQTLTVGKNMIADPDLAQYYDALMLIVKGRLLDPQRLLAIWKMNTGQYNHWINDNAYRYPNLIRKTYAEVSSTASIVKDCTSSGAIEMQDSGVEITFPEPSHAAWLEVHLDNNDRYRILYSLGKQELAAETVPTAYLPDPGGISARIIAVPEKATSTGFDRVHLFPYAGEAPYCLGSLTVR
ncbi:MAG: hypothetical protein IT308_05485 [Anaerolineaceae bacterium]|nr:hypothetical protein [Anaerolineaceae bacterium]